MRTITTATLYALAITFIVLGVKSAPATGWPMNDAQINGCALLVLGMAAKLGGHFSLAGFARR